MNLDLRNNIDLNNNKNRRELIIKGKDNKLYKLLIIKERDEIIFKSNIINDIYDNQYIIKINLKQFYNINKIFKEYKSINDIYLKCFNNIKEKDIIIYLNKNKIELKYKKEIDLILEPNKIKYENIIIKLCEKIENINNEMNKIKIENDNNKNEIKNLKIIINKNEEEKNKLENEIKEIMNKKYNEIIEIINNNKNNQNEEFNNKLLNKEKEIKEIINENKNIINNTINEKEDKINNKENKLIEDINIINNKINEIKNKIEEIINNKINEINNNINNKYNELKEQIYYIVKQIDYKFIKEPQNLKFKFDITNTNTDWGLNDMFEVFICYKDNKEYIISPNYNNYNLDIFNLLDNKKILSLKGHKNKIRTIRYFINKNNYNINEYLISGDDNKIVIIWDITNNYNIKYQIDTKYEGSIYSCLLIFPHNNNDNYIITSTFNKSDDNDKSATKIYSLNNGQFIKYINNTNNNAIYYLLSWYNKKNNKYYIIQFSYLKIMINNLLEDELYSELIQQQSESYHYSGFIYNRNDNDYLCSSSTNGYINIWDLYNKKIIKTFNTNNCCLCHIIEWNNKYIIVADYYNKSFKIIDLDENKIISNIGGQHTDEVISIKKIYHPIYGESLLSCGQDCYIKLWTI